MHSRTRHLEKKKERLSDRVVVYDPQLLGDQHAAAASAKVRLLFSLWKFCFTRNFSSSRG